ncbi:MAG: hypothetical protein LBR74_04705 [Eubacterium sp.]|jgi:hypothetical protein|nr:hypothetical protein [Eubacterium sp.]
MQKVSQAYKNSMKNPLRERAHIRIVFGVVNQEAQAKAKIDSGDFAYYSNVQNIFSPETEKPVYATLEENFTKVDGSMFFLPRQSAGNSYYDTGLVGRGLVSDADYELKINLHILTAIDFKGITINFGENYPVDFDMVSDSGQIIEFRGNTDAVFSTQEVLTNTSSVKFIFYTTKNPQSRLRVYSIRFGFGLVYYNDSVMSSTLKSYISPIGADVPQIDFTVQLKNYDKYFNVDNPKSAINFLETGQEMEIWYGYELPETGDIEWLRGNSLLCSEWESDDFTATIRCQDIYRNMDLEFYKGRYVSVGISYYDLAVTILEDAGLTDYYIDPRLKKIYTKNPMPRVQHKQALQIIANACRCTLSQTRFGTIEIKSNFIPELISLTSTGEEPYSKLQNIRNTDPKAEYGTFATNYAVANGSMSFLPESGGNYLHTGYVSSAQSDENGLFTANPILTFVQESACMYHGIKIIFGHALPAGITIRTYNDGSLVEEYVVTEEIVKNFVLLHDFDDFDTMELEFTKTAEPYNRIVVNQFAFGDITTFTMTRVDMTSSPKAIKQELIKEVIVPCYSYQNGTVEDNLINEEITVAVNDTYTFYVGEPAYNFRVEFNDSAANATILSWGNYYVTVRFNIAGTYFFELFGYRYKITERYSVVSLHSRGKTIKWANPLISDMDTANDLAAWLGDYYNSGIEYEYTTRGNPEIDANDIIYQENEFHKDMKVNVYRSTTIFNQSFSGEVTARRVGG